MLRREKYGQGGYRILHKLLRPDAFRRFDLLRGVNDRYVRLRQN